MVLDWELSIRVTLQYVLSNIIISIVPNKHNRWSHLIVKWRQSVTWILASDWSIQIMWPEYWPLIGQYRSRDLETVGDCTKLSVRPIPDPRIFKIKQTFQPFYEWSFRNVNSIFAFSVTHFWINTKTVLFEQLGLTILTEAVRCFQWYFQYHPHHQSPLSKLPSTLFPSI